MIKRLLIANRGEIACRIMATADALGIETVAVYSQHDKNALHVRRADSAYCIDSYLNIDAIVSIAKATQSDAIHPGYGFLSENPELARSCVANEITFVGPPIDAMVQMADKSVAKALMQKAGVPVTPGFYSDNADVDWQREADKIGYPVLIKAVAGGGGRGMRLIEKAEDFEAGFSAAKREALTHFADNRVFLEKYLTNPRHIELQIFADSFGDVVYLGERDCSIQRRHQKIIEEAPAPNLDPNLRERMGETAVKAAKAIGYVGAGTVEFLLDQDGQYYFMEMNTRLQVEHPVTELVTGLDLVDWQLKIAEGEKLPRHQNQIEHHGHAIEVRIYAEDPSRDFIPSTGELVHCQYPDHPHVRIDYGYESGDSISMHYDAMLSKLIVHGEDRIQACGLLAEALRHTQLVGVNTNVNFLQRIALSEPFKNAQLSTHFLADYPQLLLEPKTPPLPAVILQAALTIFDHEDFTQLENLHSSQDAFSPWALQDSWRLNAPPSRTVHLRWFDQHYQVDLVHDHLVFEGQKIALNTEALPTAIIWQNQLHLFDDQHWVFTLEDAANIDTSAVQSSDEIIAPMPGTVVELFVEHGDNVSLGDRLLIIEAMKMEHTLTAHCDGTVQALNVNQGDTVTEGMALLQVSAK